jgi:hypothetical protein
MVDIRNDAFTHCQRSSRMRSSQKSACALTHEHPVLIARRGSLQTGHTCASCSSLSTSCHCSHLFQRQAFVAALPEPADAVQDEADVV